MEILKAVNRYRYLRSGEIERLIFAENGTTQSAHRRLKYLFHNHYLGRIQPLIRPGKGSAETLGRIRDKVNWAMITIEIPIEGQIIKINVYDARQAVSLVKGFYAQKHNGTPYFELPNIEILSAKKDKFVKKHCQDMFETLRDGGYNPKRVTGSSQALKRKGGEP
ncbi:MAG: hypothetical protein HZA01_10705 [Nitrospinae bacterium]|nr:hypothetical protein [Nitrospinota bacterium]